MIGAGSLPLGCHGPVRQGAAVQVRPQALLPGSEGLYRVWLEVADTEGLRARGLMDRRSLDTDSGMLFIFPESGSYTFWMRRTYMPLDMIFLDEERRILGIVHRAEPLTDTARGGFAGTRYVIEVQGGTCEKLRVQSGMQVSWQGVPS